MKDSFPISILNSNKRAEALLKRLERTGQPVLLARGGKPLIVVQSAAAFHTMVEGRKRMDAVVDKKREAEDLKVWIPWQTWTHGNVFSRLKRKGETPFWRFMKDGCPLLIHLNGEPKIVVQDPDAYAEIQQVRERMDSILSANLAADLKPRRAKSSEDRLARFGKTQGHKD